MAFRGDSMEQTTFKNKAFMEEEKILEEINEFVAREDITVQEMKDLFLEFHEVFEKILRDYKRVARISDKMGIELNRKMNAIKSLLDNSKQGFLTFDKDFVVGKIYSKECENIFEKRITNENVLDLLCNSYPFNKELFKEVFGKAFLSKDSEIANNHLKELPQSIKLKNFIIEISYKFIDVSQSPDGKELIMLMLSDITEEVNAKNKLHYLSYHDSLTNLYNRTYVEKIVTLMDENVDYPIGIIFGDLNSLKVVNDVFGHKQGDEIIVLIADIFKRSVLEYSENFVKLKSDDIIVSRWGGDEFLILIKKANKIMLESICTNIKKECERINYSLVPPSVSLGLAIQSDKMKNFNDVFLKAEKYMYKQKVQDSYAVKQKILQNMKNFLDKNCFQLKGCVERLERLTSEMAEEIGLIKLGVSYEQISNLSKFHNVGMVVVPNEILKKKGEFTKKEEEIFKMHSEVGYRLFVAVGENIIAKVILSIHERWDGNGYPYGIQKEEIPILSRVFSIVEEFDILVEGNLYNKAVSKKEALVKIKKESGKRFDPYLVDIFTKILQNKTRVNI